MVIIGLAGKARSGKDTIANMFVKREGFTKVAFADPLKELIIKVFRLEPKYLHDEKLKEVELPDVIELDYHQIDAIREYVESVWGFVISNDQREKMESFYNTEIRTARALMQIVGTNILRACVRDDIFIVLFFSRIKDLSSKIIVSDVRLKNEREALKKAGAHLILIQRETLDSKDQHISENDLGKESDYDVVIKNNIPLQELESEVLMWYSLKAKYK